MPEVRDSFVIGDTIVLPGETRHLRLAVSESYVSTPVEIPVTIINGILEGPILLVCAASHGDECNGTAVVRELIYDVDHSNLTGVLVCAPVLNLPGFLRAERNLPDGRDLNRNFPGKPDGNSAQRIAHTIFSKIIQKCDYGIDIHTAGQGRANLVQVRGDMENNEVRRVARAFGTEIIIDELGLAGTLRRSATDIGIPMITVEIGETQRFEKHLVSMGLQGVMNVLYELGMLKGKTVEPIFQVIVKKTEWVRADRGGILEMKILPRDLVQEGEELCTITNPFGKEVGVVRAPFTGMVVGITNYPMVTPGSPICHLVKLDKTLSTVENALRREKATLAVAKGAVPAQPEKKDDKRDDRKEDKKENGKSKDELRQKKLDEIIPVAAERKEGEKKEGERKEAARKDGERKEGDKEEVDTDGRGGKHKARKDSRPGSGQVDREGHPSEYYEDYDEDAEPEEKD